jgi:hypothetical protein
MQRIILVLVFVALMAPIIFQAISVALRIN